MNVLDFPTFSAGYGSQEYSRKMQRINKLHSLRTPFAIASFAFATVGLATWLARWVAPSGLSFGWRAPLAIACATWALVWLTFDIGANSDAATIGSRSARFLAGVRRGWPCLIPLALLSLTPFLDVLSTPVLVAAGLGAGVLRVNWGAASNRALWGSLAIVGISYVAAGWHASAVLDFDGAYSFGMARHIASGHWSEPIIWQYASGHLPLPHAPFDYWPPGTALVLLGPMLAFGATERVAVATIAVLSTGAVAAFIYLVTHVLRIRSWGARLAAVGVFAFSPALGFFRSEPETIAVALLWLVLALAAFGKGRYLLATLLGVAMVFSRTDCVVLFAIIWVAGIWNVVSHSEFGVRRQVAPIVVAGVLPFALWALRSHSAFGTWWPPGAENSPFLARYHDLFAWTPTIDRAAILRSWLTWDNVQATLERTVDWIQRTQLAPYQSLWMLLVLASATRARRSRSRLETLCWAMLLLGLPAQYFAAGVVGDKQRYVILPFIAVLGGVGLDQVVLWLQQRCRSATPRIRLTWRVFAALASAGIVSLFLLKLQPYGPRPAGYAELSATLTRLDTKFHGEAVASDVPWLVFAKTRSPVIMLPGDGERAVEAALERYHIRWIVLHERIPGWMGDSKPVFARLAAATRSHVGRLTVEHVSKPGDDPVVYKVTE